MSISLYSCMGGLSRVNIFLKLEPLAELRNLPVIVSILVETSTSIRCCAAVMLKNGNRVIYLNVALAHMTDTFDLGRLTNNSVRSSLVASGLSACHNLEGFRLYA